jgi:hypothetical protein
MPVNIQRMWVNQPSSLQQFHNLHGTNVLAVEECVGTMRVYFLSGDIVSQQMPASALSLDWRGYREQAEAYSTPRSARGRWDNDTAS